MNSDFSFDTLNASKPYTVSQLNRNVRELLGNVFFNIYVEGEISNLSTPSSGHLYFSLKDAVAQIRCALFRTRQNQLDFKPANGQYVVVRAQVSLYEPRGDYQLLVDTIEIAGIGVLRRNFEQLKQKLNAEGAFDNEKKRPIPILPKSIGVITSPTGAAIRDILSVLGRRFPMVPIIVYPTAVQGEQAKTEIVQALSLANQRLDCDVIILSRGGGSLEDLWAFNEESVVRAIIASKIPIVTGIGHETDFSIADFVADLRAATPSAAAEHVVPDQQAWFQRLTSLETHCQQQMHHVLKQFKQLLLWQKQRLQQQHPGQRLLQQAQTLDQLEIRLEQTLQTRLQLARFNVRLATVRLSQQAPIKKLRHLQMQQPYLYNRLHAAIQKNLYRYQQQLTLYSQTLHAFSPLATLERGYAIVKQVGSSKIIRKSQQLQSGDMIQIRLAQGNIISQVKDVTP